MVPFAIAGIQMEISTQHENITAMGRKLDILMARFPWVQMVLFSELCAYRTLALPPSRRVAMQTESSARWLPSTASGYCLGSIFERVGDDIC